MTWSLIQPGLAVKFFVSGPCQIPLLSREECTALPNTSRIDRNNASTADCQYSDEQQDLTKTLMM